MNRTLPGLVLLCSMLATSGGCHRTPVAVTNNEPPTLPVSKPVQRQVTDYGEFTGRTVAVNSVDIRPRVTGYLTKMTYREGAEVKKDDLLFEIDPRPYQAQYDQAVGQVNLNNAALRLARTTLARDQAVASKSQGAVSLQELDQDRAAVDEADARVKAAQAALEAYKLNLSFTKVTSPIDGQVSRYYLTLGNLVNQDQTLLTTVVSLDPMYVYFDMDEPTLLRIKRAINEGRIKLPQPGADIPVYMALEGEEGYPHRGISTSSITRSTQPRARFRYAASFRMPDHRVERGCCCRACLCAHGCRWASLTRRFLSLTGPSDQIRV